MISPFPNKSSHQPWILVERINIFLHCSWSIPHGMNVFTHYQRLFPCLALSGKSDNLLATCVHPTIDVHSLCIVIGLVVDESGWIICLDQVIHGLVIPAIK